MVNLYRSVGLATLVLVLVLACSKSKAPTSNDPPDDGGNGGGDTVGVEVRVAALEAIDSVHASLADETPDSLATALVSFLDGRPEFEAVGQEGTSVWARFDDGRMVMIPNNRFPGEPIDSNSIGLLDSPDVEPSEIPGPIPETEQRSNVQRRAWSPPTSVTAPSYGLPHSILSFCASTLGDQCFQPGAYYASFLLDRAGYETKYTASVDDLMHSITNFGVFYIDSHGGVCEAENGQFLTGIWTSTDWSTSNDITYKSLLDSAELVYMYAEGGTGSGHCQDQWRYAFTGKFVAKYMTFSPNSIVYISACESDAPSLKAGFTTAGASVFVGWTMPVTAFGSNYVGAFLFDRMLGANHWTVKETPKQRPFDINLLYQDLKDRGRDWDQNTGSEVRITELNPGFGLLAPSLRHAYVINYTDTLFLTGFFGPDPGSKGHVFVNGVEQTVYKWEPTFIWTSIPDYGNGSAGPIRVEVEAQVGSPPSSGLRRKSNIITLSWWEGIITYKHENAGTLSGEILIDAIFRADVHSFRELPHTTPYPNPFIVFGGTSNVCSSAGSAAGYFLYPVPESDPPEVLTWSWTGQTPDATIDYWWQAQNDPWGQLIFQGQIDAQNKLMALQLVTVAGGAQSLIQKVESSLNGLQSEDDLVFTIPFDMYDIFPNSFTVSFDNNWDMVGESNTYNTCCSVDPGNDGSVNDVKNTVSWSTISVQFPPDPAEAQ